MLGEAYSNPYPGLRTFKFGESHLFFGREGLSEELLSRLRRNHFLAVVGTSGSGKSSLVRAGLLPLLYGGFMSGAGSDWRIAVINPGKNPIHNLAKALVNPTELEEEVSLQEKKLSESEKLEIAVTETTLRSSAVGLLDYAGGAKLAPKENLLIVVDQFEEIFRFKMESTRDNPEDEASVFIKLLLEAVHDKDARVFVVLTMRSDFLGDCAQFRDLPEAINNGQYLIPRLRREQLRQAIEAPAKVRGAQLSPVLVTNLLNDIGDDQDQLPVLQHALMRTWDKWEEEKKFDTKIELEHYTQIGGMATALSLHADEAFSELRDEGSEELSRRQIIAEILFKCLTETDYEYRETRRAMSLETICDVAEAKLEEVISVIDVFRRKGRTFLMPPPEIELDKNSLIDISHESLIRKWERLKKWVAEEALAARIYRRLAEDTLSYKLGKKSLWSNPELSGGIEWRDKFSPNENWAEIYKEKGTRQYQASFDEAMDFLSASEANYKRRRRTTMATYLLLLLAISAALITSVWAWSSIKQAQLLEQQVLLGKQVEAQKRDLERVNENLESSKKDIETKKEELEQTNGKLEEVNFELKDSLAQQEAATKEMEVQKQRADKQTELAKRNEAEKQLALEEQEKLTEAAKEATDIQKKLTEDIDRSRIRIEKIAQREQLSRVGQIYVERGENEKALETFKKLLAAYAVDADTSPKVKAEGEWWAYHNLGNIYSKLGNYVEAEKSYKAALEALGEAPDESVGIFVRPISYQTDGDINRNKIATLHKLALLYRDAAKTYLNGSREFNHLAVVQYNRLLELLELDKNYREEEIFIAGVKKELADTYFDLYENEKARQYYNEVLKVLESRREYYGIIETLKKLLDISVRVRDGDSENIAKRILAIREDQSVATDLDTAESYDNLARFSKDKDKAKYTELAQALRDWNRSFFNDSQDSPSDNFSPVILDKLVKAYLKIGKCEQAELILLSTLISIRTNYTIGSPYLAVTFQTAEFYRNILKNPEKAKEYFDFYSVEFDPEESQEFIKRAGYDVSMTEKVADYYFEQGNYSKAEQLYTYILNDKQTAGKTEDNALVEAKQLTNLARIDEKRDENRNDFSRAKEKYEQAIRLLEQSLKKDDVRIAPYLILLADFYYKHGDRKLAQDYYLRTNTFFALFQNIQKFASKNESNKSSNRSDFDPLDFVPLPLVTKSDPALENSDKYIHSLKMLGIISAAEKNNKVASRYFEETINALDTFSKLVITKGEDGKTSATLFPDPKPTAEYYKKRAEILKLLAGVSKSNSEKKYLEEAQKAEQEAEKNKVQEETFCQ